MRTDAEIQQDVFRELERDARVKATDIGVSVQVGIVTHSGVVARNADRVAAKEAAHRVVGVLVVANDLRVRLPDSASPTDDEVASAVRHALELVAPSAEVPTVHAAIREALERWARREADGVQVFVDGGTVRLSGLVHSPVEKVVIVDAARHSRGVRGVEDELRVPQPGRPITVGEPW